MQRIKQRVYCGYKAIVSSLRMNLKDERVQTGKLTEENMRVQSTGETQREKIKDLKKEHQDWRQRMLKMFQR